MCVGMWSLCKHYHEEEWLLLMAREQILVSLSQNKDSFYTPGSDVEGHATLHIEGSQLYYRRVTVTIIGRVEVYFTVLSGSEMRHYQESETFFKRSLVVWGDGTTTSELTEGRYVFPFSFCLESDSPLPSSLDTRDGRIKYTIEAKLIRMGRTDAEIEAAATYTRINVRDNVNINRSDLLAPRSAQKECTAGFLCIGRGPITVTATLLRSGYCIVVDQIPVQVVVEPGLGQQLQSVGVSLIQRVTCYAQHQPSVLHRTMTQVTNVQMPRKGVSFTWNAPPLEVSDFLELTLTNCSLVQLGYFIRIEYTSRCIDKQVIDIPVIIGNVPLSTTTSNRDGTYTGTSTQASSGYQPTLSLSDGTVGYHPPAIPTETAVSPEADHDEERVSNVTEGEKEECEVSPLLQ